jgi:hypothetical protein
MIEPCLTGPGYTKLLSLSADFDVVNGRGGPLRVAANIGGRRPVACAKPTNQINRGV